MVPRQTCALLQPRHPTDWATRRLLDRPTKSASKQSPPRTHQRRAHLLGRRHFPRTMTVRIGLLVPCRRHMAHRPVPWLIYGIQPPRTHQPQQQRRLSCHPTSTFETFRRHLATNRQCLEQWLRTTNLWDRHTLLLRLLFLLVQRLKSCKAPCLRVVRIMAAIYLAHHQPTASAAPPPRMRCCRLAPPLRLVAAPCPMTWRPLPRRRRHRRKSARSTRTAKPQPSEKAKRYRRHQAWRHKVLGKTQENFPHVHIFQIQTERRRSRYT
jgi:hypothetical protein